MCVSKIALLASLHSLCEDKVGHLLGVCVVPSSAHNVYIAFSLIEIDGNQVVSIVELCQSIVERQHRLVLQSSHRHIVCFAFYRLIARFYRSFAHNNVKDIHRADGRRECNVAVFSHSCLSLLCGIFVSSLKT